MTDYSKQAGHASAARHLARLNHRAAAPFAGGTHHDRRRNYSATGTNANAQESRVVPEPGTRQGFLMLTFPILAKQDCTNFYSLAIQGLATRKSMLLFSFVGLACKPLPAQQSQRHDTPI